jgi:uncharacterized coiled-coil protein SlyX
MDMDGVDAWVELVRAEKRGAELADRNAELEGLVGHHRATIRRLRRQVRALVRTLRAERVSTPPPFPRSRGPT